MCKLVKQDKPREGFALLSLAEVGFEPTSKDYEPFKETTPPLRINPRHLHPLYLIRKNICCKCLFFKCPLVFTGLELSLARLHLVLRERVESEKRKERLFILAPITI